MSEVELCHDRRLNRPVARKRLRDDLRDSVELRHRFMREIQVQSQLDHPAIVPVFDCGQDANGQDFFTMRRISGQTLSEALDQLAVLPTPTERRRERSRLLTAFLRACLAIDYAHSRGVIHRDIKPDNLMIGPFGELYVLDWGVAKVCSEADDPLVTDSRGVQGSLTQIRKTLGTPAFMSPEQHRNPTTVTARSDVYSLGAVLFQILTDRPLREDEDWPTGAALRPSRHAPDLPPEYDIICMRACAVAPGERFESARALHDAVEAVIQGNRDLILRRDLARSHLDRARSARCEATTLREIGMALSLDPNNTDASTLLTQKLLTPAEDDPEALIAERNRSVKTDRRRLLTTTALSAQALLAIGLLVVALHPLLRPELLIILFVPVFLALNAMMLDAIWSQSSAAELLRPLLTGISLSIGLIALATLFGPWIMPPLAAVMAGTAFAGISSDRWRWLVISPLLLTLAGILITYTVLGSELGLSVTGTGILIEPMMISFDPSWTVPSVSAALFLCVLSPIAVVWLNTDALLRTRQRLLRSQWRLRQLTTAPPPR